MARTLTMTFFILTLFSLPSQGQTDFRVMSYNVENLFDTKDDPLTADNDFLPSGNRHWTSGRFYHKLQQLAKVITAAGEWSTPALIGLCEVENDSVLVRLLDFTPLRRQQQLGHDHILQHLKILRHRSPVCFNMRFQFYHGTHFLAFRVNHLLQKF